MIITEPMTMGTDYLLAVVCFAFTLRLRERRGARFMALAFAVTGVAALLGGTAHGFRLPLGVYWEWVWAATVAGIAAGSLLLIGGSIRASVRSLSSRRAEGIDWMKRAIGITVIALALLVGEVSFHRDFNQNDLYHLVQLVGLFCLYRGTRLLSAAGRPPEIAR